MDDRIELDLKPVDHITTDAIGPAGKRVFYIQGRKADQVVTLIVEKFQVQTLAVGVEQFLAEILEKFPELDDVASDYEESEMHIQPPVDPLFRVGEIGLGYDVDSDLVALVARAVVLEGGDPDDADLVRFWASRAQMRTMVHWGLEVAARGRQQPEDEDVTPRLNGHKH